MKYVEPIRDLKTIKNMRAVLRNQSVRNELLFILGINVGLRVSDIVKLKVGDIVKMGKVPKEYVVITEKKTKKTKKFYIGKTVEKVILDYLKEYIDVTDESYVFFSRKGDNMPITRQQAYRILNGAAEQLGIVERDEKNHIVVGEIGTHTLRKTFGYHAYMGGTSLRLLMALFNHSSESQTLRYIGITEEQKKEVYLNSNLG